MAPSTYVYQWLYIQSFPLNMRTPSPFLSITHQVIEYLTEQYKDEKITTQLKQTTQCLKMINGGSRVVYKSEHKDSQKQS